MRDAKSDKMSVFKRLYIIIYDVGQNIGQQNICAFASSAAFFIFLSLMPILMLLSTLLRFTPITEVLLIETVNEAVPVAFQDYMTSLVVQAYNSSAGAISIAILVTIWSAANGCMALMRGFNAIYMVTERRNYFILRLQACVYTIFMLLMVVAMLIALVFGEMIITFVSARVPELAPFLGSINNLRYPVGIIVLTFFLSLLYTFMPNKKLKLRYQFPGAFLTAVVWEIFSWAYSLYLGKFGLNTAYGSLTVIVTMMFWMYFLIYIMMIGGYLNCYFSPMYYILFRKHPARDLKEELLRTANNKIKSIEEEVDKDEDYRFKMGKSVRPFASSVQDRTKNSK